MSRDIDSILNDLSTEHLRAIVDRASRQPRDVPVRRSLGSAFAWLFFAAVLLPLGVLCLKNFHAVGIAVAIGLGLVGLGVFNLVRGLIGVCDRSPQLTVGGEALIDHRTGRRYTYEGILRATLHRTTRNGSEESATMTLFLSDLYREAKVELDLMNLTPDAATIFRVLGERANLS